MSGPSQLNIGAIQWTGPRGEKQAATARTEARANAEESRAEAREKRAQAEFDIKYNPVPAPGDTTKTGEDYLKTVPPGIANQVRAMADGRLAMPTLTGRSNLSAQRLVAAALQYDPSMDAANVATRMATRKSFTSGQMRQNITSLNTVMGHINDLAASMAAMHNTSYPWLNEPLNKARARGMGKPEVTNFNMKADAVAAELAKVFKGTGATSVTEINEWRKNLDPNMSPEQFAGAVQTMVKLIDSRMDAVGQAYQAGMGRSQDPVTFLTPKAQKVYQSLESGDLVKPILQGTDMPQPGAPTRTGLLEAPPEGQQIAGQSLQAPRFSDATVAALTDYARSDPNFTPEGFTSKLADAAVAEKIIPPNMRDAYYQSALPEQQAYFSQIKDRSTIPSALDYSHADEAARQNAGLGDVAMSAVKNAPESLFNLATGLTKLPADAVASVAEGARVGSIKSMTDLATELVKSAGGAPTGPTVKAFEDMLNDRYGSWGAIKNTVATDPAGFLADASTLLTGGGAAVAKTGALLGKVPGIAADIGSGLSTVGGKIATTGTAIDPLTAARTGVPAAIDAAQARFPGFQPGKAVSEAVGFPSGIGGETVSQAYQAGKSAGQAGAPTAESTAFTSNMRQPTDNVGNVVQVARDAVGNLRDQASQRYMAAMQQFGKNPVPLDPSKITEALDAVKPKSYDTMLNAPKRPSDHLAYDAMKETVEHYLGAAADDPTLLHPLNVDQFKQDLYDVGSKVGGAYDRDAARITGRVYNGIKQTLNDHDPVYSSIMGDYEKAATEAQSLENSFNLSQARGKPVNIDAATRKLQSILRNNANTNYGMRAAQGERLAELDPTGTLMPSLAGQSASSYIPRGLRGGVAGADLATAVLLGHPGVATAAVPFVPRVVGEAAYGAGKAVGTGQRYVGAIGDTLDALRQKYPAVGNFVAQHPAMVAETENRMRDVKDRADLMRQYGILPPVTAYPGE